MLSKHCCHYNTQPISLSPTFFLSLSPSRPLSLPRSLFLSFPNKETVSFVTECYNSCEQLHTCTEAIKTMSRSPWEDFISMKRHMKVTTLRRALSVQTDSHEGIKSFLFLFFPVLYLFAFHCAAQTPFFSMHILRND